MTLPLTRPVLDKGHISLFRTLPHIDDLTPTPPGISSLDRAIAQYARASTVSGAEPAWDMGLKTAALDAKLIKYLWDNGHVSPFQHVIIQLHVKCPDFVFRQWERHWSWHYHIATPTVNIDKDAYDSDIFFGNQALDATEPWSYNVQSGRYQEYEDEYYIPDQWRLQDVKNKQGSGGFLSMSDDPDEMTDSVLANTWYQEAIGQAHSNYKALLMLGVAREQARLVLPAFALYTEFYATTNLRNYIYWLKARLHPHAQYEIRQFAEAGLKLLRQVAPLTTNLVFGEVKETNS